MLLKIASLKGGFQLQVVLSNVDFNTEKLANCRFTMLKDKLEHHSSFVIMDVIHSINDKAVLHLTINSFVVG